MTLLKNDFQNRIVGDDFSRKYTPLGKFYSIQEAREFPWAPRSNWGTPSRSHPDQGFQPEII